MADEKLIRRVILNFEKPFNFSDLKSFITSHLKFMGYNFDETKFEWKGDTETGAFEIEINGAKVVDDYVKYGIFIKMKGKNQKNIVILIDGKMIKDYNNFWELSPIRKYFKKIYENYIIKDRLKKHGNSIWGEVEELKNKIKDFFK